MENSVMLNAVCNEPVSLKVVKEPFYRKGFSPFVNKETGTWWEYDDDKKGFFDTGIIAQGRDGNDYVITEQDYNTIVERTLSNVNPTLDDMINVVKDDLSDLAPAGANVGQLFRVAAISKDGKYTMEPVDMLDVQIDGESIVQDGVANIPIANGFGKTGIVRLAESLGVKWSYANGGGLSIDYATIDNISNRVSSNRPIIPYHLGYAVKAAMCDGKGAPWTAEEQAAARERMGITSTLMSFNDQTIPYGAEGLGRIIAGYYQKANYDNPVLVAACIALYGNTALVFGVYRPQANMSMLCIEDTSIKRLFKNNLEEWSFEHFTLY